MYPHTFFALPLKRPLAPTSFPLSSPLSGPRGIHAILHHCKSLGRKKDLPDQTSNVFIEAEQKTSRKRRQSFVVSAIQAKDDVNSFNGSGGGGANTCQTETDVSRASFRGL